MSETPPRLTKFQWFCSILSLSLLLVFPGCNSGTGSKEILKTVDTSQQESLTNRIPPRVGARPKTSEAPPNTRLAHQQLSQNAPPALQEMLLSKVSALPGVRIGPSLISVPGARAFFLEDLYALGPPEAFIVQNEFAHLHPPQDGSLHLILPKEVQHVIVEAGWGEPHPRSPRTSMIYGPRNEEELEWVWEIFMVSFRFANGSLEIESH